MNRRAVIPLCVVLVLIVGGQAFSQTRVTFKGTNYASAAMKAMPVDKDHIVLVGEQMGVEINDQPAFNYMSTHFSVIAYFVKDSGWHFHGYGVYADKDGDTLLLEIWDFPAGADGGKGKLIGGTGKFAGAQGTAEFVNERPRGWPESTGRVICRETWNLTLKNPL
ncbi:MAG TPA: hypothetical protein VMV03_17135 [Spirochaetia bacterium]|nr:hypothetical protein [Spirochaetia bacterium]